MHRFFVKTNQISDSIICITGIDVNHIKNVLRMQTGDEIIVSDGEGLEYVCVVAEIDEAEVLVKIVDAKKAGQELGSKIYLFQGLPKSDKMELIIQKAVELGVFEIVPVAMSRCVVKLDEKKATSKVKRWQGVAESAAKQAGRMIIPQVNKVCSFNEALNIAKDLDVCLMPYELAEDMSKTKAILNSINVGQSIGVFIGPEGGFAETEVDKAKENLVTPITLGKRILRTETAGITTLSILMFLMEDK